MKADQDREACLRTSPQRDPLTHRDPGDDVFHATRREPLATGWGRARFPRATSAA
jgi:hypothetical protein